MHSDYMHILHITLIKHLFLICSELSLEELIKLHHTYIYLNNHFSTKHCECIQLSSRKKSVKHIWGNSYSNDSFVRATCYSESHNRTEQKR